MLAHPGVADAAVVAADDPARGAVVRAVLVANGTVPRARLVEEVQAAVRDRLGRHAYPRIVDFVDELPRTETGKVRRNLLRAGAG
ncbi:MAG: acetyl-CoA synthetase [Pseudonocardiales bacterium]|nr:acetyl-CoA synthetase [Pseudonocardiales bacterium]